MSAEICFSACGGAILSDVGALGLREARDLAHFYAREAEAAGASPWVRRCAERADALERAIAAASSWRRAAGWADPEAADRPRERMTPSGR
ncbi:MAG: hypothetical protein ACRED9_10285 [Caulobacteraceae bacterium]